MSFSQFTEYDDDTNFFAMGEEPDTEELGYTEESGYAEEMPISEESFRLDGQDNIPIQIKKYIDLDKRYKETHKIRHRQQVIFIEEDGDYDKLILQSLTDPKRSIPFLTKFERSALISERATNLYENKLKGKRRLLKIFLDHVDPSWSPIEIATREVDQKRLPVIIRRRLPSGKEELWKLQDLQNSFYMFEPNKMEYN
jgi:hypothetical protein